MLKRVLLLLGITLLLSGCFEGHGKVHISGDRDGLSYSVDGDLIKSIKKDHSYSVGKHTLVATKKIDDYFEYKGEKKFTVIKDKTVDVSVKTLKIPTAKKLQQIAEDKSFNPQHYTFKPYVFYTPAQLQTIRAKIDKLIEHKEFAKINPAEVIKSGYREKIVNILAKLKKEQKQLLKRFQPVRTISGEGKVHSVAISSDSRYIVFGSYNTITVWSFKSGKLLRTLKGDSREVTSVAISSDNRYIVSGGFYSGTIGGWNLQNGKLLLKLGGIGYVWSVAISGDNHYIVSGNHEGYINVWSTQSGKLLRTLKGHSSDVYSVAISSDNRYIVSGSRDHTIKIWNLKSGKLLHTLKGHSDSVYSVAISSDNRYIVSGSSDYTIKIWNLKSGKLLRTLKHSGCVFSVAISSDNRYIVSGSSDDTVKVWSLHSGKLLRTLKGHNEIVYSVAISSDNRYIVSGSSDDTVKVWKLGDDFTKKAIQLPLVTKEIASCKSIIKKATIPPKLLNINYEYVYKYGKIGEIYVPTTTYTSYTPHTSVTTINGHSFTQTTTSTSTSHGGGYYTSREGYTAINRITNNSDNYYLLQVKSSWRGKYTQVSSQTNTWTDNTSNSYDSAYKNGHKINTFIIPPHKSIKFQFIIGENKAKVTTKIYKAEIVPKEYAIKLSEALNTKNEDLILIDKFLKDKKIAVWHDRLEATKKRIIRQRDDEFTRVYADDVKTTLSLASNYDSDFGGEVTISISVPKPMCVYFNAGFGEKKVFVTGEKEMHYKGIKGLDSSSSVEINKVVPNCD